VVGHADGLSQVKTAGGATVTVACERSLSGAVKLLLRAERAKVVAARSGRGDVPTLSGRIASSDYFGMLVRYSVEVSGQRISVVQPIEGGVFVAGDEVAVEIPTRAWMLF
jgi:hypothetical protein